MKKTFILCMAALALCFVSCKNNEEEGADLQQQRIDSLQRIVDEKDGAIDELFDLLTQIEENLSLVTDKYSKVQNLRNSGVENGNVKGEIQNQISTIEGMLADNKDKLAKLNSKIAAQGKENSKLQEFVANLEERIANQENQISQLLTELEQNKVVIRGLNENINTLTQSNQEKDATIARQVAEANKAYYIVENAKELVKKGITSKSGGFLGIGKKTSTSTDMGTEHFTCIDRSKVTTITVNKKGATILSKHPADSYEAVMDENDPKVTAYIKILNPSTFWRQSPYLVISYK